LQYSPEPAWDTVTKNKGNNAVYVQLFIAAQIYIIFIKCSPVSMLLLFCYIWQTRIQSLFSVCILFQVCSSFTIIF